MRQNHHLVPGSCRVYTGISPKVDFLVASRLWKNWNISSKKVTIGSNYLALKPVTLSNGKSIRARQVQSCTCRPQMCDVIQFDAMRKSSSSKLASNLTIAFATTTKMEGLPPQLFLRSQEIRRSKERFPGRMSRARQIFRRPAPKTGCGHLWYLHCMRRSASWSSSNKYFGSQILKLILSFDS